MKNRIFNFFLCSLFLIVFGVFFIGCKNENDSESSATSNEIFMNETAYFETGVSFEIYECKEKYQISDGFYNYTTDDKFLVIGLRVYNGSSEVFKADATDVWLTYNGAKINQQSIVKGYANGYNDISQSVTVTKEYYLFFEVGKDVAIKDLKLIIHNGKILKSESVIIKLENAPKDCQVTLNYSYDDKIENYEYYSETTLVVSNFPTPSRSGYKFMGWYFNEDYSGEMFTSVILQKSQKLNLYAKWEEIKIAIRYDGNGSDGGETKEQIVQIGTTITLNKNGFIKNGFKFVGWTKNKGENAILEEQGVYEISLNEQDFILYAKWEKEIETVDDFNLINSNNDCIYILKNDLDFTGKEVVSIENFLGVFNGNGYTLKNSENSLFVSNEGTIKNLIIENCKIASCLNVEDYQIVYGGMLIYNKGLISNCSVLLEFNETVQDSCIGGICAFNVNGEINASRVELDVKIIETSEVSSLTCLGGVSGFSSLGKITNSYVIGTIHMSNNDVVNGTTVVGGIVGKSDSSTLEKCYTNIEMDIQSKSRRELSGIVGIGKNNTFNSCVAMGNITIVTTYIFTISGIQSDDSNYVCSINNCYTNNELKIPHYPYLGGEYGANGTKIEAAEFYKRSFYLDNNILNEYTNEENLKNDPTAVWIIVDGELPKLYWE